MKTNVTKKRHMRRLRKKNIWAPIVVFIAILFFAMLLSFIIWNVSILAMVSEKMGAADENGRILAKSIYSEMAKGNDGFETIISEYEQVNDTEVYVCIYRDGKVYKNFAKDMKIPEKYQVYHLNSKEQYKIGVMDTDGISFGENSVKIDFAYIMAGMVKVMDKADSETDVMNLDMIRVRYWNDFSFENSDYEIAILEDVRIKGRNLFYICIIGGMVCFFAIIPLVVLFIYTIRAAITQRKIYNLLYFDAETGMHNWTYFSIQSERILKKRKNLSKKYALVNMHLNKFRTYCSYYGITEGEKLLLGVSSILKKEFKKDDICARYAKSEFVILLKCREDENLTDRINHVLDAFINIEAERYVNFSVGICELDPDPERTYRNKSFDINVFFNNSNITRKAAYSQKSTRGNVIAFFDDRIISDQNWERKVEDTMEFALTNKEFKVYLQPKYSTQTEKLSGAEALIRWISPTEGFIAPNKFIPIFEKNGFIIKIDDFMISEVARLQAEWIKEGKNVVPVSVNVSRIHFQNEHLAEHICELVNAYNVPHEVIELELTESAFFDDKKLIFDTVNKLREFGFAVSMDDFGAGYSSLNSLKDLPLDIVKLDAEFFRGNDNGNRGDIVIKEAIKLAKELEMKIVAEGIETREQVDFLKQNGCDFIQGYYYAKPMSTDSFEKEAFE